MCASLLLVSRLAHSSHTRRTCAASSTRLRPAGCARSASILSPNSVPTWQLSPLPAVPGYWRATPIDLSPFFEKPVSEVLNQITPEGVAHEVGVPAGSVRRGSDTLLL